MGCIRDIRNCTRFLPWRSKSYGLRRATAEKTRLGLSSSETRGTRAAVLTYRTIGRAREETGLTGFNCLGRTVQRVFKSSPESTPGSGRGGRDKNIWACRAQNFAP